MMYAQSKGIYYVQVSLVLAGGGEVGAPVSSVWLVPS